MRREIGGLLCLLVAGCGASERPAVYAVGLEDVAIAALPDVSCTPADAALGPVDLSPLRDGGTSWSCFAPEPRPLPPVLITVRFLVLVDGARTRGTARICANEDVRCAEPLATAETDAMSVLEFTVPRSDGGFSGFIDMTGTEFLPTRTYIWPPFTDDFSGTLAVGSHQLIRSLTGGSRVLNGHGGLLAAVAKGCVGYPVAGVRAALDAMCADVPRLYDVPDGFSAEATETGIAGTALFVGLPEGTYSVSGYRADTGGRLGTRRVFVRAGWVTGAIVTP